MKLQYKLFITSILTLSSFALSGQSINEESLESCNHEEVEAPGLTLLNQKPSRRSSQNNDKKVFGSYLTNDFVDMLFTDAAGLQLVGKSMRYNLQTNTFEFLVNGKVEYVSGDAIAQFEYLNKEGKKRLFANTKGYSGLSEMPNGFFEVLEIGRVGLISHNKVVSKKVYADNGEGLESTNSLGLKTSYYFEKNTELIPVTSFNKRSLVAFGEHTEEVRKFIKSNKLKFKRQDDLAALAKFYAGLIH